MNFFCNCHSGTAPACQCNLHCCLRTLHALSTSGATKAIYALGSQVCSLLYPAVQISLQSRNPVYCPTFLLQPPPQLHLTLETAFRPELSAEAPFAPGASSPSLGSSWGCGEQGGCLVPVCHDGFSAHWELVLKCAGEMPLKRCWR